MSRLLRWSWVLVLGLTPGSAAAEEVGLLADWRKIELVGAETYPAERILTVLREDPTLVPLRHGKADLDRFLAALGERVTRGYRFRGFPDVTAQATVRLRKTRRFIQIQVREGPRFHTGQVTAKSETGLPAELVQQALLSRRDNTTGLPTDAGPGPSTRSPLWTSDQPVRFDEIWRLSAKSLLIRLHANHGLYDVVPSFQFQRRENGVADLEVTVVGSGKRLEFGPVEVRGAERHDPAMLERWLERECGIRPGLEARYELVMKAREKLHGTGRFLEERVIFDPRREGSPLVVEVVEGKKLPLLDAALTPRQELFLRMRRWFVEEVQGGAVDLAARVTLTRFEFEVVYSFRRGLIITGRSLPGREPAIELVAALDGDAFTWLSSRRQKAVHLVTDRIGSTLVAKLLTKRPGKDGSTRTAQFGFGFRGQGQRIDIELSPSVCLASASDDWKEAPGEGYRVLTLGEKKSEIQVEPDSGRVLLLDAKWPGGTVRIEPGARRYAERLAEIEQRVTSHGTIDSGQVPFSRTFGAIVEDLMAAVESAGLTRPTYDPERARLGVRAFTAGALEPIERFLRDRDSGPKDEFALPPIPAPAMQDPMAIAKLGVDQLLVLALEYFDPTDWPLMVLTEVSNVLHGQTRHTGATLRQLGVPQRMGPIGFLVTSKLLAQLRHPATPHFARMGKQGLEFPRFWDDLDILFQGNEHLKPFFLAIEQPEPLLAWIPEEDREETRTLLKRLASEEGSRAEETIRELLQILWEPVLRPLLVSAFES